MPDPLRDPLASEEISAARRAGYWALYHRNALRLALLLLIAAFAIYGLFVERRDAVDGSTGFAIALAVAWGIAEILWFLIDRASPDSAAKPEE